MQEIIADQFDFVAAKDHEIPNALMRVEFHDMPHDGATADLHHWLGLDRGFLTQAGSETTGEQRDLHADTFSEERSEEHTSELPSLMRISYAVFCLKKKTN